MLQVIGAATQCALGTSQLVACAKVVAPTISDPMCQEQLVEAAREVAKSVEGCVATCNDVSRDDHSLRELGQSAADVTRALNELLNHVKDGHSDKIPDIMEQIMSASGELIASYNTSEMVRQAKILAQSTAELIQAIKGEAETQSDSDLQVMRSQTLFLLLDEGRTCTYAFLPLLMQKPTKTHVAGRCISGPASAPGLLQGAGWAQFPAARGRNEPCSEL